MTGLIHAPVVIIGAGPTGVTAAGLLGQYGVESLVLEYYPAATPAWKLAGVPDGTPSPGCPGHLRT